MCTMISEFVHCDICGVKIPKEKKHMWHNINVVRHSSKDLTASFHVCNSDLKNILFEIFGTDVNDNHRKSLDEKILKKLRLSI